MGYRDRCGEIGAHRALVRFTGVAVESGRNVDRRHPRPGFVSQIVHFDCERCEGRTQRAACSDSEQAVEKQEGTGSTAGHEPLMLQFEPLQGAQLAPGQNTQLRWCMVRAGYDLPARAPEHLERHQGVAAVVSGAEIGHRGSRSGVKADEAFTEPAARLVHESLGRDSASKSGFLERPHLLATHQAHAAMFVDRPAGAKAFGGCRRPAGIAHFERFVSDRPRTAERISIQFTPTGSASTRLSASAGNGRSPPRSRAQFRRGRFPSSCGNAHGRGSRSRPQPGPPDSVNSGSRSNAQI